MVSPMQQVHDLDKVGQKGLLTISRGTALLLLATYVAYLVFQVRIPFHGDMSINTNVVSVTRLWCW